MSHRSGTRKSRAHPVIHVLLYMFAFLYKEFETKGFANYRFAFCEGDFAEYVTEMHVSEMKADLSQEFVA